MRPRIGERLADEPQMGRHGFQPLRTLHIPKDTRFLGHPPGHAQEGTEFGLPGGTERGGNSLQLRHGKVSGHLGFIAIGEGHDILDEVSDN